MNTKKTVLMIIAIFLMGLIIIGSSYAFWVWNSNTNKNVNFSTADLKNYVIYDDGESTFDDSLEVDSPIYATIAINKNSNATDLFASVYLSIDSIGTNMRNSPALKWKVTSGGDTTFNNTAVASGDFIGTADGDTILLMLNLPVTLLTNNNPTKYTVWIWIDSSEDYSNLSGEKLDAKIWTEINQSQSAFHSLSTFYYTGDYQRYTVPVTGYYKIEAWGAKGGSYNTTTCVGGKGSYTSGYLYMEQGEKYYIYVGGSGIGDGTHAARAGGYNGGGDATSNSDGNTRQSSGGGATDIRYFGNTVPTSSDLMWNSTLGLNSRIMVAAGGGGGAGNSATKCVAGGNGGTITGVNGGTYTESNWSATGTGGMQNSGGNAGGSFGSGGSTYAAGGGGGYYGGGSVHYSAGGGSSFISGYSGCNAITSATDGTHTGQPDHYSGKIFVDGTMTAGTNSGDGYATITYYGTTAP